MPTNQVGRVLAAAHVLLVHLKDDPLYETSIPSKTQAYMHVGKPVLMAVRGDAAKLIATSGAGCLALPEDDKSIADAVIKMSQLPAEALEAMGKRGSEFYIQHLSLAIGAQKFEALFRAVSGAR